MSDSNSPSFDDQFPVANVFVPGSLGEAGDDAPTVVLPMQLVNLDDAGRTDVGRQRNHNEDQFFIRTDTLRHEGPQGRNLKAQGLYILCDGMGGHACGEVASAKTVQFLRNFFKERWTDQQLPNEQTIREAILAANAEIYHANLENESYGSGRMGTTLVMLLVQDTNVAIAHVGDSRVYRYTRKNHLEQLTLDHELGQVEILRGVDPDIAYSMPDAYQLTQAIGPRDNEFVYPDIRFLEVQEDTLFLLCSDGLSDNELLDEYQETHVQPLLSSRTNIETGVIELIDLANEYNGHDNITVIAVRLKVKPNMSLLP
ncbi:MAG: serine/threonine phosphatase [Prochlorotrichaceae cyanobacterium]|jgi:protein phosphatase